MIAGHQGGLKLLHLVMLCLGCAVNCAVAQQPPSRESGPPCGEIDYRAVEVVENLWRFASSGELLYSEGWTQASAFFTQQRDAPRDFSVVANRYWISDVSQKSGGIEIAVESEEIGYVNSELRLVASRESHSNPHFYLYHLAFRPTPARMYGPDGKTLLKETMTGPDRWTIVGSLAYRWATVNSAILYLTQVHDSTADPVIKKNAEQTLSVLRRHH